MPEKRVGLIERISGPLVVAREMEFARLHEVVRVGEKKLIGEIIELHGDRAAIQVYEETTGLKPEEPVISLGQPLSVVLGPGLIGSIYDGLQRPLAVLRETVGDFVARGVTAPRLDHQRKWAFQPLVKRGQQVTAGDILGQVPETAVITHRVLVPPQVQRAVVDHIEAGEFTIEEPVAILKTDGGQLPVYLTQEWMVRRPRPIRRRLEPEEPLLTGQRVIDTFFPLLKGGTACVPGPFGSGKTVVQHQIAKWADAQVIVYIGCGERGNEMTDVLQEFPRLIDPYSGRPLMERTILIANTSNMPVAAREASIYTGITLAEYYRDMGYHVAVMADSTSRWAEALREISGRLEEMPGEEGYPAYLASRIAEFYERAGRVQCLGSDEREGSVSIIGAVSPPGGDLSDPVVQSTLRVVKVFWSLDDRLAYERHFPAINWLTSYSLYDRAFDRALEKKGLSRTGADRHLAMRLLEQEDELKEIVRLVGLEALSAEQRLILRTARAIREDFLHQNAFDPADTFTSLPKQAHLLRTIMFWHQQALEALRQGVAVETLFELPFWQELARAKTIPEDQLERFQQLQQKIEQQIQAIIHQQKQPAAATEETSQRPSGSGQTVAE